jgi:hypothetical protein
MAPSAGREGRQETYSITELSKTRESVNLKFTVSAGDFCAAVPNFTILTTGP